MRFTLLCLLLCACDSKTDTPTTTPADTGATDLTDGIGATCDDPPMLVFTDEAHFQSVADQLDTELMAWTDDGSLSPLEDFEAALGFDSLRASLSAQAEALADSTDGLDPAADPEDFWLEDDTLRALLNTGLEVQIGESILKFIDECHYIEITNGDCETLGLLREVLADRERADRWRAYAGGLENVVIHSECDESYKTAGGCAIEMSADAGSKPREVTFTSAVYPAESVYMKWENEAYIWDFGDGSSGSGASTAHEYAGSGSYTMGVSFSGDLYEEICVYDSGSQTWICDWEYQDSYTCSSDTETHFISSTCFEDFAHETDGCGNLRVQDTSKCWDSGVSQYADCGGTSSWLVDGDSFSGNYGDWEVISSGGTELHEVCVGNSNCSGEECQSCAEAFSILQCDSDISEKESVLWSDDGEERAVIAKLTGTNWLLSRRIKGKVVVRKVKSNGNYGAKKQTGYLWAGMDGEVYDRGDHDAACDALLGTMQLTSDRYSSKSHREVYIAGSAWRVHPEEVSGTFFVAEDGNGTNQSQTLTLTHGEGTCYQ